VRIASSRGALGPRIPPSYQPRARARVRRAAVDHVRDVVGTPKRRGAAAGRPRGGDRVGLGEGYQRAAIGGGADQLGLPEAGVGRLARLRPSQGVVTCQLLLTPRSAAHICTCYIGN
jgi:hypothetical protein